jgi:hypothetical protein
MIGLLLATCQAEEIKFHYQIQGMATECFLENMTEGHKAEVSVNPWHYEDNLTYMMMVNNPSGREVDR